MRILVLLIHKINVNINFKNYISGQLFTKIFYIYLFSKFNFFFSIFISFILSILKFIIFIYIYIKYDAEINENMLKKFILYFYINFLQLKSDISGI